MGLICEDLALYGVVLVPPSAESYLGLRADIERILRTRREGWPPEEEALDRISKSSASAILLNRSAVAIASIAYFWWFRTREDRIVPHQFLPGTNASVLLPYCLHPAVKRFAGFWHTIFPGSKRLMTADGRCYGDNTDVRVPAPDELWRGGFAGARSPSPAGRLEPVMLTIDGVFFADGGFAGPNELRSWERTSFAAETYLSCGKLAREAREHADSPVAFFLQITRLTGFQEDTPPSPPPRPSGTADLDSIRARERWGVGARVFWMRENLGEEGAIESIAAWTDMPAPHLHKL